MNEGILQSSPVQQMVAAGSNNWFTNNSVLAAIPQNPIPHHFTPPPAPPISWPPSHELPHSWSQLVLGFGGEEDEAEISHMHHSSMDTQLVTGANEENTAACYTYTTGNLDFTAATSTPVVSASPPRSCVTMFSNKSSENLMKCNTTSGAAKKPKMNPTTSSQPGIKVRKQKLGDRITALHQIVSPFGKTDTASVLLEAIGYIRFLQRQIEALSLPYLGSESGNIHVKRERSCLFPEDPGQLLHENQRKRKAISQEDCDEEAKKDLKSRGLCLVPLSCTLDNNEGDYWAPAPFNGKFQ